MFKILFIVVSNHVYVFDTLVSVKPTSICVCKKGWNTDKAFSTCEMTIFFLLLGKLPTNVLAPLYSDNLRSQPGLGYWKDDPVKDVYMTAYKKPCLYYDKILVNGDSGVLDDILVIFTLKDVWNIGPFLEWEKPNWAELEVIEMLRVPELNWAKLKLN